MKKDFQLLKTLKDMQKRMDDRYSIDKMPPEVETIVEHLKPILLQKVDMHSGALTNLIRDTFHEELSNGRLTISQSDAMVICVHAFKSLRHLVKHYYNIFDSSRNSSSAINTNDAPASQNGSSTSTNGASVCNMDEQTSTNGRSSQHDALGGSSNMTAKPNLSTVKTLDDVIDSVIVHELKRSNSPECSDILHASILGFLTKPEGENDSEEDMM